MSTSVKLRVMTVTITQLVSIPMDRIFAFVTLDMVEPEGIVQVKSKSETILRISEHSVGTAKIRTTDKIFHIRHVSRSNILFVDHS